MLDQVAATWVGSHDYHLDGPCNLHLGNHVITIWAYYMTAKCLGYVISVRLGQVIAIWVGHVATSCWYPMAII